MVRKNGSEVIRKQTETRTFRPPIYTRCILVQGRPRQYNKKNDTDANAPKGSTHICFV